MRGDTRPTILLVDDNPQIRSFIRPALACNLGNLSPELAATVTVEVIAPTTGGTIDNTASVSAFNTLDLNPADNSATEPTSVLIPEGVPGLAQWGLIAMAVVLGGLSYLSIACRVLGSRRP